jgi:hypothetical protein
MSDWKKLLMVTVAMTVIAQVIHTLESILTLDYYMDPAYFGVWSKIMMPTAGPPPAAFYCYSVTFALVSWAIFGFVYEKLEGAIREKGEIRRGLKFGILVFLIAGIPTILLLVSSASTIFRGSTSPSLEQVRFHAKRVHDLAHNVINEVVDGFGFVVESWAGW